MKNTDIVWEKWVGLDVRSFTHRYEASNPEQMVNKYVVDLKNGYIMGKVDGVPKNIEDVILTKLKEKHIIEKTKDGYVWVE